MPSARPFLTFDSAALGISEIEPLGGCRIDRAVNCLVDCFLIIAACGRCPLNWKTFATIVIQMHDATVP